MFGLITLDMFVSEVFSNSQIPSTSLSVICASGGRVGVWGRYRMVGGITVNP